MTNKRSLFQRMILRKGRLTPPGISPSRYTITTVMKSTVHLATVVIVEVVPLERGTGKVVVVVEDAVVVAPPVVAAPALLVTAAHLAIAALPHMIVEIGAAGSVGDAIVATAEVLGPKPTQLTTILIWKIM